MSSYGGRVLAELFEDDGTFPNSPLPLMLYPGVFPREDDNTEALEALFRAHGWAPMWRSTIYGFHHYHSLAHECIGIARGEALLMMGGPTGRRFEVGAGDVMVIPAGVAHQQVGASGDFLAIGAYPPGPDRDLLRGAAGERPQADANIARVRLPKSDPVCGEGGPLMDWWRRAAVK